MALPIPIVVDNFADYYSEQKKLEAKEQKREAQVKQAEFDTEAVRLANKSLVNTLAKQPGPFTTPPTSPQTETVHSAYKDKWNEQIILIVSLNKLF